MENARQLKRKFAFQLGLLLGLAATLVAFEWKSYQWQIATERKLDLQPIEDEYLPITIQRTPKPPKPKVESNQMEVVEEILKPEPEKNQDFDPIEIEDDNPWIEMEFYPPIVDEDEPISISQQMPEFPGGEKAMYQFLRDNINYPELATKHAIEGTVYLKFVIERDGSVSNIEILQGVPGGAMCDREAIRVVEKMPKWMPGKQRGREVRVNFTLPIRFKLKK